MVFEQCLWHFRNNRYSRLHRTLLEKCALFLSLSSPLLSSSPDTPPNAKTTRGINNSCWTLLYRESETERVYCRVCVHLPVWVWVCVCGGGEEHCCHITVTVQWGKHNDCDAEDEIKLLGDFSSQHMLGCQHFVILWATQAKKALRNILLATLLDTLASTGLAPCMPSEVP